MRFLLVTLLLIGPHVFAGTVYRSVDKEGNVQYSDRPGSQNAELVVVRTQRPAPRSSSVRPPSAPAATAAQPQEEEIEQGPTPEELAAERAENCKIARERLERYVTSRRLYRLQDDGERVYLSDQELDEARAKAQADVEEWCS